MAKIYPFPFAWSTVQKFAKPDKPPVWERLCPDWTPESEVPLHLACMDAELEKGRDLLRIIQTHTIPRCNPPETRHHLAMLSGVFDHVLQGFEELYDLGRETVDRDPVIRRAITEDHEEEYPFPISEGTRKHIRETFPANRFTWKTAIPAWTPDLGIPLHVGAIGAWMHQTHNLVHEADERINGLEPGSELRVTMEAFVDIMDKSLDALQDLLVDGCLTMGSDPLVRQFVKENETVDPKCSDAVEQAVTSPPSPATTD
ncbi:MAG: hypothetical protein ACOYXY_21895 [Thermodesulfobacteriota bacterium]